MREFCLTEEVIQQFVDGELSAAQNETAAAHLAACDECAQLLDSVEQENEVLMQAFAPEMSLPVPSAALRERIDAAVAELAPRPNVGREAGGALRVRNWFASLFGSFSFTPQQAFGFASIAAVIAFAAIFAVIQLRQGSNATTSVAVNSKPQPKVEQSPAPVKEGIDKPSAPAPAVESTVASLNPGSQPKQRRVAPKATVKSSDGSTTTDVTPTPATATASTGTKLLPGEKGYLEAIASLTIAIEANKNDVLKPAVRADYERSLAVVDQAIATTRMQAKRNPKDRDAAEFMYTAYQSKIDLLSAVADQTRIASR
jgi:anti-sigma factor RsiW